MLPPLPAAPSPTLACGPWSWLALEVVPMFRTQRERQFSLTRGSLCSHLMGYISYWMAWTQRIRGVTLSTMK